jgi:hypothetical protein
MVPLQAGEAVRHVCEDVGEDIREGNVTKTMLAKILVCLLVISVALCSRSNYSMGVEKFAELSMISSSGRTCLLAHQLIGQNSRKKNSINK